MRLLILIGILQQNPPNQLFHPRAHHNLRADFLNGNYLIRSANQRALEKSTLAATIFTHSLQPLYSKRQDSNNFL